jgi:threonine dehydratase
MTLYNEIISAAKKIHPFIRKTPFIHSDAFSELTGAEVWFKLENLQVTGSFKARGATNKLLSLNATEKARGVVSASTGNHGAAVAYAAGKLGIECTIYVPDDTSSTKLENMKQFGAKIEIHGHDCILAEAKAREVADGSGKTYVSPYNDLFVMAGQGTIGVEIGSQCEGLDAIVISVGGGGLIGGTASYLKTVWPKIHVIGCSPENSAVMLHSIKAGKVLDMESKPTLSDGTAGGVEENTITFPVCCDVIDESVLVTEDEIKQAMSLYIEKEDQLLEGAAGTAVAALLEKKADLKGQRVGVVICGGNISLDTVRSIIN